MDECAASESEATIWFLIRFSIYVNYSVVNINDGETSSSLISLPVTEDVLFFTADLIFC